MERDRRGYPYRTDNNHKGRGVKNPLRTQRCAHMARENGVMELQN